MSKGTNLQLWNDIIKRKLDHRNHRFNMHTAMAISHAIEVAIRKEHSDSSGVDAMPQSRRDLILLLCLQFAMPLVDASTSSFVLDKSEHVRSVPKLFKTAVAFKPRPVAAMIVSNTPATSGKVGKGKKTEKKPSRKRKGVEIETPSAAPPDPTDADTTVADPATVQLKVLTVLSKCIDESLWQLTCRGDNGIDVDADPECKPKIVDILSVGLQLLFGGGEPVQTGVGDQQSSIGTLFEFREFASSKLKEFAKGYLAIKNWQALPEPKTTCANTSDSNGRNGEAEAAEVEAGAVPHQLNVLGGDEAVEFLAFLRKRKLQPLSARSIEPRLLSWRLGADPATQTLTSLLQMIINLVSADIWPTWVAEAADMYTRKTYNVCFESIDEVRAFLQLRPTIIVDLLIGSVGSIVPSFPNTQLQKSLATLAAADSMIIRADELFSFWDPLVKHFAEYNMATFESDAAFAFDIAEMVADVQESLCLVEEQEPSKIVVTASPPAPAADIIEAGSSTVAVPMAASESPEDESKESKDSKDDDIKPMTKSILMTLWFDDVRTSKTGQTRAPAVVLQLKTKIEELLFTMSKKDGQVNFTKTGKNFAMESTKLKKTSKESPAAMQLTLGGRVTLSPTPLCYLAASVGSTLNLYVDGSEADVFYPYVGWAVPKSDDPQEITMNIIDETTTVKVNGGSGRAVAEFEITLKTLVLTDGLESDPQTLCRTIGIFDGETAKSKAGPKSYAAKINAALGKDPCLFGAARKRPLPDNVADAIPKKTKASKTKSDSALSQYDPSCRFLFADSVDTSGDIVLNY